MGCAASIRFSQASAGGQEEQPSDVNNSMTTGTLAPASGVAHFAAKDIPMKRIPRHLAFFMRSPSAELKGAIGQHYISKTRLLSRMIHIYPFSHVSRLARIDPPASSGLPSRRHEMPNPGFNSNLAAGFIFHGRPRARANRTRAFHHLACGAHARCEECAHRFAGRDPD